MADVVTGAMSSIIPKLYQLLQEEYNLQTGVKERISSLMLELELAQAALSKVAEVPWDQLDKQVQIWARKVREASYDMEDILDTFLVRVKGPDSDEEMKQNSLKKHVKKMTNFFKKSKARRKISGDVMNIMTHLDEVTKRCRMYKVEDIVTRTDTTSTIDPRLHAMYTQVNKLVGVDKSSGELISMLQTNPQLGDASSTKMKKVSIVGVGGLGKTTLAKVVYDEVKRDFDSTAFVPVGRNPDLKKVFKDILVDLDKQKYLYISTAALDEKQLIDELRNFFLENKRYLIIIDDIWDIQSWETIKLAIDDDKNSGGRIIITTRNMEVATKADKVYELQPLPDNRSRELLYSRIYGHEARHVDSQPDKISDKFIRKCCGIPLAIITMASLLAGKPRDKWSELYNTIDFGSKYNKEAENTMRILSFSYYDLPSHLRTCLMYLSAFPEDSVIDKGSLVWKWVAEGFVEENVGISLFEIGERYFNDLINRSMIQVVESDNEDNVVIGCRVHDVVLDFIRSMSREENFFMVLDSSNDQGTLLESNNGNLRRLANHDRTIGHTHQTPKLRSFLSLRCVIQSWAPFSSFTLLRVLAIEKCKPRDGHLVRVEDLGHLLHLRYLSLRSTRIGRIPEEIGALRFLQTLDLLHSGILELPWNCSLPKHLLCLCIKLEAADGYNGGNVFSVEGMTSLEELEITAMCPKTTGRLVKELGSLRELRVLDASILINKESKRDLVESLRGLHKLQSLKITGDTWSARVPWQATELDLPRHLRDLCVLRIQFCKLPSCINPPYLPNLSYLYLWLQDVDEQDLKSLGGLPELRFLGLSLWSSSATMSNISDDDTDAAGYFPKLRCCRLPWSLVLFVGNKECKSSVSFHIWNGKDDIGIVPSVSDDDELKNVDHEYELQSPPRPSVPDDDELHHIPVQPSSCKLWHGLAALAYNYLLALFLHVMAFVKRLSLRKVAQYTSNDSNHGSEVLAAIPSVVSDEGSAAAPPSSFMLSLQVLHLGVRGAVIESNPNCCDNLSLEYLSSLREINVTLYGKNGDSKDKVEAALRRAAQAHPNSPMLRINQN